MTGDTFLALVHNAALLLALAFLYDLVTERWRTARDPLRQVPVGLAVGAIGMAVMLSPWRYAPGIVFDTRSVVLAVSGLFFGSVPTVIAMAMTAALRLSQGGAAAWAGTLVILASGLLGIAWRRLRQPALAEISLLDLYGLGIVVHLTMLGLMFTLPFETAIRVVSAIGLPVMVIYPASTAALGALLASRLRRERAMDRLRESESRFRTLFDQAGVGVGLVDASTGRYLRVNRRYAEILGYSCEEMLGLDFRVVTHPEDVAADEEQTARLARGEIREFTMEKRDVRKDGSTCWVALTVSRMDGTDAGPGARTHIAVVQDITPRKRAEEALQELNASLEARVRERTAELEAANEEQESFSYSVSHDLRAPLRAIEGFSAMAAARESLASDAEGQRLLAVVRTNARRMAELVDDLLHFSRTSRAEMRRRPLEMERLVRAAFAEAVEEPERRERIDFSVGDLPGVEGDHSLMKQVWLNLLSNAVKFSSGLERPVVRVEGSRTGSECVFVVRDHGPGFDMRYAGKLFGVFQRLPGSAAVEGTGVGLALVKRIVEKHGGRVWAESRPGEGAAFFFSLPA